MAKVSYVLREDPNTILLLQDAGKRYAQFCQITTFGRFLVRPEFFGQYMYFVPFIGVNGKYRGSVTDIRMSIEDNDYKPMWDYVAVIDSEVEFRVTPSIIRQLSRDYMPSWGVKSYLDYFSDKKSGILLFLRVYKVLQPLASSFLEKGVRGSSQVLKLYNKYGEDVTLPVDVIEPVISDNKFSYLKDEILHLLKVENVLIALFDNTEHGLKSLQDRVLADRHIQNMKKHWSRGRLIGTGGDPDVFDDFDMAQLDYGSIFQEVLEIAPGMKNTIEYIKNIHAPRIGEYDYCLNEIHGHTENEKASANRLFEMSLRFAVKSALYYHKQYNVDLEDAFQEACIGVLKAIQKHTENVEGLFPSYVSMWIRQRMNRGLPPYIHNMRVPVHYSDHIVQVVRQLPEIFNNEYLESIDYQELYYLLLKNTDCDEQEAYRLAYLLVPAARIDDLIHDSFMEEYFVDERDYYTEIQNKIALDVVRDAMKTLTKREQEVLVYRFGFDGHAENSLEDVGNILEITRERVRQIEEKAKIKVLSYCYRNRLITREKYYSLIAVDEKGNIRLSSGKMAHVVKHRNKK